MQVWKRRLAFVLAVGTGTVGLTLSSAGAQTSPPDFPFPTFPTFPDFPTIPSTSPPPTMPPPTVTTTPPPPTMPPTSVTFPTFPTIPPPTMPPTTSPPVTSPPPTMPPITSPPTSVPSTDDFLDDLLSRLEEFAEDSPFEEVREIVDEIIADFLD